MGQLEQLVTSLMNTRSTSQPTDGYPTESQDFQDAESPSPVGPHDPTRDPQSQNAGQLSDSFGRISLQSTEISYVDNTHWTAVLDGVWHFPVSLLLYSVLTS